jgi:2-dehydro-3-deoxyphosphogluconate aldolase / (4S)-4-hydroxy-2-oxoglutarate aldolase
MRAESSLALKKHGIVAIVRGDFSETRILEIAEVLRENGVSCLEVTLNSSNALSGIEKLRAKFPEMFIGAGTIRNQNQLLDAVNAGAQFGVSPNCDEATICLALELEFLQLPGVLTPTEMQKAFSLGCKMQKLFPCEVLGPAYLKAVRAPLNDIEFVPTGGVSSKNIGEYAKAGAVAVGVGGSLVSKNQTLEELALKAKEIKLAWDKRHE